MADDVTHHKPFVVFCCLQPEDATGQLDYRYDEFGFKVEEEGKFV